MTEIQNALVNAIGNMHCGIALRLTDDRFKEDAVAAFRIARLLSHDCFECYRATGETRCSKTCKHAEVR